jgi:peptide/nickel transport system substrate-binding protein
MHLKRAIPFAAVAASVALVLAACSPSTDSVKPAHAETLHLGAVTALSSFAPWQSGWANQSPYLQAVYDTILQASPSGKVEPDLATAWKWNGTRTTLTLTLRKHVVFSNGTPLNAAAVAESLTHFKNGTSENSPYLAGMVSATATNSTTVVVKLKAADPAFAWYLTQNPGLVGAPAMYHSSNAQTTPIGSGPYVLDAAKTVVGSKWVFDAKKHYWDPTSVHYSQIVITAYGDATSLLDALKGGQIDAAPAQTPTQVPEAEAAGYKTQFAKGAWTGFILADRKGTLNPALGDVRVRQAINYALDRKGLVKALADGYGTPTTQVFGVSSGAYVTALDNRYPYDVAKAKKLLAEAGYPHGFTLAMPSSSFVPEAQYAIQASALAAVGITVDWQPTGADLFGRMLSGSWAAFPFILGPDPSPWLTAQNSLLPGATWNPFHVDDPKIVAYTEQLRTAKGAAANTIAKKLNTYVVNQAWFAPMYLLQSAFFTAKGTNVVLQSDNAYPYLRNITPAS